MGRTSVWCGLWIIAACAPRGVAPPEPLEPPAFPAPATPLAPPLAASPPATALPLAWPVAPFSRAQISAARACTPGAVAKTRYPATLAIADLHAAFAAHGVCDYAALAAACATRMGHNAPPQSCLDAYAAAVLANPALAFTNDLLAFAGDVPLVAPPPAAAHALTTIAIDYRWRGMGTPMGWKLTVRDATTAPKLQLDRATTTKTSLDTALTLALPKALGSFMPVPEPIQAVSCTDNDPDWKVTLGFDDGEQLTLVTNRSNVFHRGGPWQLQDGERTYLQLAPDFAHALAAVVDALALPLGEPAGMYCHGFDFEGAVYGN